MQQYFLIALEGEEIGDDEYKGNCYSVTTQHHLCYH